MLLYFSFGRLLISDFDNWHFNLPWKDERMTLFWEDSSVLK